MNRALIWGGTAALTLLAAWQAAPAIENAVSAKPAGVIKPVVVAKPAQPLVVPPVKNLTPMAERVATIGLLNKRNGLSRDIIMKPGEARRIGDVVVRLKACETTAPYEQDPLTGAFVQVIVHGADDKWRKVFSGWLFKESPSLNAVEHPIYDVWTKACVMRFPDTGPETLVVHGGDSSGDAGDASDKSKARKSHRVAPVDAPDSAADSNPI